MTEPVLLDARDGVATITLNRPGAMNALDTAAKEALLGAVHSVAENAAVRAVVLTGTGRAFCVGQDLREYVAQRRTRSREELFRTVGEHYAPTCAALAGMAKPVVAAVNGVAAGAGMSLACACDFRFVADTAGFNTAFVGIGLSPDTGLSWLLPRLVGDAKAIDLLMLPRTVTAVEALELGLATRVLPAAELGAATAEFARTLAAGPTVAYGHVRRLVRYAASHSLDETMRLEQELVTAAGGTADHADAVAAFLEKRAPTWAGR
jgi:2-(1,2-epoxy-1,2-dihydrophenyl)acetyl-CoA isomerase